MMQGLLYSVIVYPIIYIFPAYVANGAPVIFGKKAQPLDFNRRLGDKPVFGKHKTINGTVGGLLSGVIIGYIESFWFPYMLSIGILLSIGTLFGDLLGSFIKRRLNIEEGRRVFLFDQYPFLIFALLFAFPLDNMPSILGVIFLFVLTGFLHILTNYLANKLKLKKVPW